MRINGCKISVGALIASGENINNDEKVINHTFAVILDMVDFAINYGETSNYDDKDVVFAGFVSVTQNGTTSSSYFQSETNLPTNSYTSDKYGTFYGISYNTIKG